MSVFDLVTLTRAGCWHIHETQWLQSWCHNNPILLSWNTEVRQKLFEAGKSFQNLGAQWKDNSQMPNSQTKNISIKKKLVPKTLGNKCQDDILTTSIKYFMWTKKHVRYFTNPTKKFSTAYTCLTLLSPQSACTLKGVLLPNYIHKPICPKIFVNVRKTAWNMHACVSKYKSLDQGGIVVLSPAILLEWCNEHLIYTGHHNTQNVTEAQLTPPTTVSDRRANPVKTSPCLDLITKPSDMTCTRSSYKRPTTGYVPITVPTKTVPPPTTSTPTPSPRPHPALRVTVAPALQVHPEATYCWWMKSMKWLHCCTLTRPRLQTL